MFSQSTATNERRIIAKWRKFKTNKAVAPSLTSDDCQRMRQLEERAHSSKDAVVKLDYEKVLDQRHKNSL